LLSFTFEFAWAQHGKEPKDWHPVRVRYWHDLSRPAKPELLKNVSDITKLPGRTRADYGLSVALSPSDPPPELPM